MYRVEKACQELSTTESPPYNGQRPEPLWATITLLVFSCIDGDRSDKTCKLPRQVPVFSVYTYK